MVSSVWSSLLDLTSPPIGFLVQINREQSPPIIMIMPKLRPKCAQNIQKASGAQFGHYAREIGVLFYAQLHNEQFCQEQEGLVSNMETNYISNMESNMGTNYNSQRQQRHLKAHSWCWEKERKEQFVKSVWSQKSSVWYQKTERETVNRKGKQEQ